MRYAIVIEKGEHNYSAYAPDLPGCIATAESLAEVREDIRAAVEFHIEGLRADALPIPDPTTLCEYVDTPAA